MSLKSEVQVFASELKRQTAVNEILFSILLVKSVLKKSVFDRNVINAQEIIGNHASSE